MSATSFKLYNWQCQDWKTWRNNILARQLGPFTHFDGLYLKHMKTSIYINEAMIYYLWKHSVTVNNLPQTVDKRDL